MDLTLIDLNNNNTNLIRTTMTMLKDTSIHLFGVTYPKFPIDVPYRFHKGHSALMSAEIFEHLYKLKDVDTYQKRRKTPSFSYGDTRRVLRSPRRAEGG